MISPSSASSFWCQTARISCRRLPMPGSSWGQSNSARLVTQKRVAVVNTCAATARLCRCMLALSDCAARRGLRGHSAPVAAGAEHMTFGDPDFFQRHRSCHPAGAGLARGIPYLTYDVTIGKSKHLLRYAEHLPTLRETGRVLITSAVEAVQTASCTCWTKGIRARILTL